MLFSNEIEGARPSWRALTMLMLVPANILEESHFQCEGTVAMCAESSVQCSFSPCAYGIRGIHSPANEISSSHLVAVDQRNNDVSVKTENTLFSRGKAKQLVITSFRLDPIPTTQ